MVVWTGSCVYIFEKYSQFESSYQKWFCNLYSFISFGIMIFFEIRIFIYLFNNSSFLFLFLRYESRCLHKSGMSIALVIDYLFIFLFFGFFFYWKFLEYWFGSWIILCYEWVVITFAMARLNVFCQMQYYDWMWHGHIGDQIGTKLWSRATNMS